MKYSKALGLTIQWKYSQGPATPLYFKTPLPCLSGPHAVFKQQHPFYPAIDFTRNPNVQKGQQCLPWRSKHRWGPRIEPHGAHGGGVPNS